MASVTYRFGEFRVDPARRELRRGDEKRELPLRAFQCLLHLLENRDRAVSHDELIDQVWGGAHMSDGVVAQAIVSARRALDDTAQEPRYIETVRGFGYRWAAPVEAVAPQIVEIEEEAAAAAPLRGGGSLWLWAALAVTVFAGLAAGAIYLQRHPDPDDIGSSSVPRGEGEIALLLPVTVDDDPDHAWIRLGLMDLIATRLREAGQAMVPSETVVPITNGSASAPDEDEIEHWTETTGAHLVLAGQARLTAGRWTVSLRSIHGARPPLIAYGEAPDVLAAARNAADQLIVSLELTPTPDTDTDPDLAILMRRIKAAILAQQPDVARDLIASADRAQREEPLVRLASAWLEYGGRHLESAHAAFEALLEEPEFRRDPVLESEALLGIAGVLYQRADYTAAANRLVEATRLLDPGDNPNLFGTITRNLGLVILHQGRFDAARTYFARARRAHRSTGSAQGLATLDNNLGLLLGLQGRFAEALYYMKRAADANAALGNVGAELRDRANVVEILLGLLEPRTAMALEPRLAELTDQAANPELIALGNTARAAVLTANGRSETAEKLLNDVLRFTEGRDALYAARMWASLLRAERLAREGDVARAADVAVEIVGRESSRNIGPLADYLGRAWLIVLRARLRDGDLAAAGDIVAAMEDWAKRSSVQAPRFYFALATAELAATAGEAQAAEVHYVRALSRADPGQLPLQLLQVAETYVPWLLATRLDGDGKSDQAVLVADRLDRYAVQDYRAALLQLSVYHALGPPSAWRGALDRVRSLAGERQIPPGLLDAPDPTLAPADSLSG